MIDERLRRAMLWGNLNVAQPTILQAVKDDAMIDVTQLPKNPALDRWVAELEARGEAQMLVKILRRRGFDLSGEREAQVLATTDRTLLDAWVDRALTAAALDEVFG